MWIVALISAAAAILIYYWYQVRLRKYHTAYERDRKASLDIRIPDEVTRKEIAQYCPCVVCHKVQYACDCTIRCLASDVHDDENPREWRRIAYYRMMNRIK